MGFSLVAASRGYSPAAVGRLLTAAASLVEHRLKLVDLSSCATRALLLL